ncbi:GGDEF domain-containing protein [Comamonas sp. NLF-1-9]|uniref:GGDEF domain-containing protein n=1 Tax=Comamonas sp. NLF-1-9 TaxID=2853163 RepID=UPI001C48D0A9|nr:GGDEF domain-containing protein [Comamonas sp. NLF-1-9]QXL84507.1 diguanylate cyclase [Comamonas sp. NLF-1-9]
MASHFLNSFLPTEEGWLIGEGLADPRWRIRRWDGEFVDRGAEDDYLGHAQKFMARQLLMVLWTWLAMVALFAVLDYAALGWSSSFAVLLLVRLAGAVCFLALAAAVRRRPMIAARGRAISILLALSVAAYLLVIAMRPQISLWVYGMTPLLLFMLFSFVPNRLRYSLALAITLAVCMLPMVGWIHGWAAREQGILALLLAWPIALGYYTMRRVQRLQRMQFALRETLRRQAAIDPLTGLYNRREFHHRAAQEVARARREGSNLSMLMFDLDHFKRINDRYGHAAGDAVLQAVADLARSVFRYCDVVCRVGGEEFIVLLPASNLDAAARAAERFLQRLRASDIVFGGQRLPVRATLGAATLGTRSLDGLMRLADSALYAGKQAGRDRAMLVDADGAVRPLPEGGPGDQVMAA